MVCVGWDVGVVVLRVVCDPLGVVVLWLVEGREAVVVPEPCEPGVEVLVVEMTCGMNGSLAWKVERKSKTTTLVVVVVTVPGSRHGNGRCRGAGVSQPTTESRHAAKMSVPITRKEARLC